MNKKWENPKLEQLSLKDTECPGAWRYQYQCMDENCYNIDNFYGSEFEPETKPCLCGGTMKMTARWWSDSFCTGECS